MQQDRKHRSEEREPDETALDPRDRAHVDAPAGDDPKLSDPAPANPDLITLSSERGILLPGAGGHRSGRVAKDRDLRVQLSIFPLQKLGKGKL
jgi:hypothetical protein